MSEPLTTLDLDISRIVSLGQRMLVRGCRQRCLYDPNRASRWYNAVITLKRQRLLYYAALASKLPDAEQK